MVGTDHTNWHPPFFSIWPIVLLFIKVNQLLRQVKLVIPGDIFFHNTFQGGLVIIAYAIPWLITFDLTIGNPQGTIGIGVKSLLFKNFHLSLQKSPLQ